MRKLKHRWVSSSNIPLEEANREIKLMYDAYVGEDKPIFCPQLAPITDGDIKWADMVLRNQGP